MRQINLMESFFKKKDKPSQLQQQRVTPQKPQLKQTAQKMIDQLKNDKMIPQLILECDNKQIGNNGQQSVNDFKELINNGDFSYEKIVIKSSKRKMDIDDDNDDRLIAKPTQNRSYQFVDQLEEQEQIQNVNEEEKMGKSGRKRGRSVGKSAGKMVGEDDKPRKSNAMTIVQANADQDAEQFVDVTPQWATQQGCRDIRGRRPDHPQYDPTTLFVPPSAQKDFTQTMKQYWRIKSENFDKIILFKLGKFYQMFYDDALVGNRYLDLKWMGHKMHVGFPQKCLQRYAYQFVQMGYRLVVVEQLQTPQQMKDRIGRQKSAGKRGQKTLQRGITQVVTKGTIVSFVDDKQYLPNYLIAVSRHNNLLGYSLLQMGTNLIMVGVYDNIQDFKTMLFQTRPVQLLYDPDNLPVDIVDIMKLSWLNMVLSKLSNRDNAWHPINAKNQVQSFVKEREMNVPAVFQVLEKGNADQEKIILTTLAGMFRYLKNLMKFDYIMSAVRFAFYQTEGSSMSLVMDSQALQHLEIFQTPLGEKDSLFQKIDRTRTKFGRRTLRRWLMQPLLDPIKINQRLDAIQDLENNRMDRDRVADILGRLPDLQRIVNRLYHYSVKTIAQKAIYFEDVHSSRLRQFRELIDHFNKSWYGLELLRKHKHQFKSKRLIQLLTCIDSTKSDNDNIGDGLLPLVRQSLAQFDQYIKWDGDIPHPQKGLVQSYDMLQQQAANMRVKLEEYLEQLRFQTGIPILKYVHTKERYQIQFPEELQKKRPADTIFVSKRSGYSRYVTPQSKKLVADLEYVEGQIKQQMGLFVGYFFQQFRKNQKTWQKYVEILSQIDCLISMSVYSMQSHGVRPQFVQSGFRIDQARHPCLPKIDVIPNSIDLGQRIMLLTGPNMGGKSTMLRTACLMVILSQTGYYVPADVYQCQIIDRIFTRIGASDRLQQGKSTFFIQMQQTKSILRYGTHKSLAIIDELGRGTSTFDGMAIAFSVLKDLIQRVNCRCLFATHYHILAKQFQLVQQVQLKMMDFIVANQKIVFLYKLKDGRVQQSFGLNVARVVKINADILRLAEDNAKKMEKQIEMRDRNKNVREVMKMLQIRM